MNGEPAVPAVWQQKQFGESCAIGEGSSSPQIDQLAKALSAAQADMGTAPMDARNPYFGSRYSSLGAIIQASKAALGKHSLSLLQKPTWVGDKLTMRTILLHASGQWIDCGTMEATVSVPPPKPGKQPLSIVQAAGSIITYLRRYSRQAVCQVYGDEDTDENGHPTETERAEVPPDASDSSATQEYIPPALPEQFWGPTQKPTNKTLMWILGRLKAAPGQPNYAALSDWLRFTKVLAQGKNAEDWPLDMLPNSRVAFESVQAALAKHKADAEGQTK